MVSSTATWFEAWSNSRFWDSSTPGAHFHTPSSLIPGISDLVADIARIHGLRRIVDIGAGNGNLLFALAALEEFELVGVDQHPIAGLEKSVQAHWRGTWVPDISPILAEPAVLVAVEWLDDLPAQVVHSDGDRWRQVLVDGSPGPLVDAATSTWLERWWEPTRGAAEVGLGRDRAWAQVAEAAAPGSVLVVLDYGHLHGQRRSTFTGFHQGRQVRPDAAWADHMNLTAHVAVDAVDAAVRATGARRLDLCRLRDLVDPAPPFPDKAPELANNPLDELAARSERALLKEPGGLGDFWWLTHLVR